jgi:dolichyl-phosphate-mannose-protein mannosyltransferase
LSRQVLENFHFRIHDSLSEGPLVSPPLPSLLTASLAILVLIGIVVIARWSRNRTNNPSRVAAFLSGPWSPVVAGIVTVVLVRIVWGSFHEPGVAHDERAYLLQAEIFASGHWTAPAPPIAAFFEQMHVFIAPAVFAKYPPAHALTLVPGIWLGLPGLMPALLTGIAGALVFWLARRLADQWTALLTWWLWTTAWATLHWSASYFSETTSTAMWLIALWATLRWLDSGRSAYLFCVAAALGWGVEARPLTMAALALPLAFVILRRVSAARAWRSLAAPVVLGASMLALGPLWNQQTLGDWRLDPYPYYSRVYFPFDKPGFGADPAPPLRPLVPEIAAVGERTRDVHARYRLSSLPSAFAQRLIGILVWCSDGWRLALGVLVVAAALRASGVERAGVFTIALLLLAYLSFAHPPIWIVYYLEVLPIFYFLAAREIGRVVHKFGGPGSDASIGRSAPAANASLAIALLLLPFGLNDVRRVRAANDVRGAFHRAAEATMAKLPPEKAIVFVSYPPSQNPHLGLTSNEPDLAATLRWVVYDRGARNAELRALAPDRMAYRLDAATMRVDRLP